MTQTSDPLINLLKNQKFTKPIIAFVDFDGTLYTAGYNMLRALFYNRKTSSILHDLNIPLVIVTGRAIWNRLAQKQLSFFGVKKPQAIIAGAGTTIYYTDSSGKVVIDKSWQNHMKKTVVSQVENGKVRKTLWNKEKIAQFLYSNPLIKIVSQSNDPDDEFVLRFFTNKISLSQLEKIIKSINASFPNGIKIEISEKLLQKNTIEVFSGDLFIMPQTAGKEKAVAYLLKKYSNTIKTPLHGYCFGDASIDTDMLTMPENPKYYTLSQFGVHLTPLAHKTLSNVQNSSLTISNQEGPKIILSEFQKLKQPHFTPVQNSPARKLIQPFEKALNKIVYPSLTANEISFKGLDLVVQGVDKIYNVNNSYLIRFQGLKDVLIGNSLDLIDGIRSRQSTTRHALSVTSQSDGQLVDVLCDRSKEFYQLYKRAQLHLSSPPQANRHKPTATGYITLLAAISTILPSIARTKVEINGLIVSENDPKGGSMFNRTKLLIKSLILDIIGQHIRSYQFDQKIFENNMNTYKNRLSILEASSNLEPRTSNLSSKALARYQLLINLLREENEIILKFLGKYPEYKNKYQKEFIPQIQTYLADATKDKNQYPNLSLYTALHF